MLCHTCNKSINIYLLKLDVLHITTQILAEKANKPINLYCKEPQIFSEVNAGKKTCLRVKTSYFITYPDNC